MAISRTCLLDLDRARDHLAGRGIDMLIGSGYVNYGYIAGYFTHFGRDYPGPLINGRPLVRFSGLAADPGISPFLITYPGEESDIVAQGSWIEDQRFWGPRYSMPGRPDPLQLEVDPVRSLARAIEERDLAGATIGLDMSEISVSQFGEIESTLPDAKLVDAGPDFSELRMIKTPEEIDRLRGAVAGVERGHTAVREHLAEGMTELELAAIVKRAVTDEHTDRYIVHVSAGGRGSYVLAPTETPLRRGGLLSVDVCSIHKNYCGDMFHVYAFGEQRSDALEVHAALDEVNSLLIRALRPGVSASELYELGESEVKKRGLELALDFVGHGIGIDVHEPPYLVRDSDTVLQRNMVVVLEVAVRRFDLGHLSAEITCLLTGSGCEILNNQPYTITQVP